MARSFVDRNGTQWQVWKTAPGSPTFVAPELASGWLTFASDAGRRRLYPIPNNWETVADERLDLMCRAAMPVAEA
jgi:hypothetical protein